MNRLLWLLPGFAHDLLHWLTGYRQVAHFNPNGKKPVFFVWIHDFDYYGKYGGERSE